MHIVCCIKQVPDTAQVKIDPDTNTLIRSGVESICNPYDLVAAETAVRLAEKYGGKVTVITMGPPQAESALRECLALGAREAVLLSDRAFAGADTLATSYTLARAISTLDAQEPVHLVICGKQAIDGDTAQTGPGVATRLGYLRSGLMRSFFYDDQANDITTHFFKQGTVVISMKSFNDQVPSRENIIAMEDCELDVITYTDMQELMEAAPAWRQIAKDTDEFKYNDLMNRSIQLQTLSASERYQLFVRKHPDILQRVALRHIASYLGIDIATLSRIRRSV